MSSSQDEGTWCFPGPSIRTAVATIKLACFTVVDSFYGSIRIDEGNDVKQRWVQAARAVGCAEGTGHTTPI